MLARFAFVFVVFHFVPGGLSVLPWMSSLPMMSFSVHPTDAGYGEVPLWDDSELDGGSRKGFRQSWLRKRRFPEDDPASSPSTAQPDPAPVLQDSHQYQTSRSTATSSDRTASVANSFIHRMRTSSIVLPWEQP